MHWAAQYLGTPYVRGADGADGADCWALVRRVLREQRAIDMPALAIAQQGNARAIRACFDGWRAADEPQEFDIVTMKNRNGHHVGIVAKNDGADVMILHSDEPQSNIITLALLSRIGYKDFSFWRYYGTR